MAHYTEKEHVSVSDLGQFSLTALNASIETAFNAFANKQKLERRCQHAGPGIEFKCTWQIGHKLKRLGI